jgi:hypothetical protein
MVPRIHAREEARPIGQGRWRLHRLESSECASRHQTVNVWEAFGAEPFDETQVETIKAEH